MSASTSSSKIISKIFVYVLVIGGAFLMMVPFAWMVDTSFKAPSEVSTWPPVWTTKNAASSYLFKTQIRQKSSSASLDLSSLSLSEFRNFAALLEDSKSLDTLMINLEDDPLRRGEVELQLLSRDGSRAKYAISVSEAEFESLVQEFEALKDSLPQEYETVLAGLPLERAGAFLDLFFGVSTYSEQGFIKRVVLVNSLKAQYEKTIESLSRSLETTFKELPIDSDLTKALKAQFRESGGKAIGETLGELGETASTLDAYRTGTSGVTSLEEIKELTGELSRSLALIETLSGELLSEAARLAGEDQKLALSLKQLERTLESAPRGLREWANLLRLYSEVRDFYNAAQNSSLSSGTIVGKIRTDRKVYELVREAILAWDMEEKTKTYLLEELSPSNIRRAVTILLTHLDEAYKETLANYFDKPQSVLESVNEAMNFLRTSLLMAGEAELQERARATMAGGGTYEELRNLIFQTAAAAGQSIAAGGVLAGLDRYAAISTRDTFAQLIRRRWRETELVGAFSRLHSDTFGELDLSEKPAEVERVYLRGLTSQSGAKAFEVKLRGIPAVWLKDDLSFGKANFTFAETVQNFFQNYVTAWNAAPFGTYYFNTVLVAMVTTFLEIIFAAMAAFAFAKLEFFGKNFIFTLFLATMMVPGEVLLVPNYITLTALGWIDTYYALIVPWVVSVFAIFLLRQHFMTIPNELYDAAMIDGLSKWKFLWTILVPLSKPAVITGALLKFVGSWNAFLWVLIVTKSPEIRTLPVGLQNFSSATGSDYHLLMAAATFSVIPVVVLFLVTQKYFIAGIARSGLK